MWGRFKWHMFITSFIPLWVTIILLDAWDTVINFQAAWNKELLFFQNLWACIEISLVQIVSIIIILIVVLISVVKFESFIRKRRTSPNDRAVIKTAKKEKSLSTEYLLSYILPLIAFDFGNLRDVIIFLIFFFVLAFLCIRNSNIYTNIYLEFRRYKIFTCNIERTIMDKATLFENCFVLSKNDLEQDIGENMAYWDFDNTHYIKTNEVQK